MMILLGMLMVALWIVIVLASRSITTFFHEMGHAIPALFFTDQSVEVYIGSYGDISKSIKINIGRLVIYFKFNFLAWNIGLCRHRRVQHLVPELIIILGGPLMSIIVSAFLIKYMMQNNVSDAVASIFGVFIFSAVLDFIVNIWPNEKPYQLHDGNQLYNDGAQLKKSIREASFPDAYFSALNKYEQKNYGEAANELESILNSGFKKREIYSLLCECHEKNGNLDAAEKHYEAYHDQFKFRTVDYANLGAFFIKRGHYEEALNCLEKALHKDFRNAHILNNRGVALLEIGQAEMAIQDFTLAIHYQSNFADAFRNRGWAKIKSGQLDNALQDIEIAIKYDDKAPFSYFYLGKYFEKKWQFENALEQYEKAKALAIDHHGIDFEIAETRRTIEMRKK